MSFEEKLISLVEKNPILYNKSVAGYKNISIKCRIWDSIAKELSQCDDTCEKRWKSLRDRYTRESRKLIMTDWEHWEALGFLKDHIKPRNSRDKFVLLHDTTQYTSPQSTITEDNIKEEYDSLDCEEFLNDTPVKKRILSESTNDDNSNETNGSFKTPTPDKKAQINEMFTNKLAQTMDVFNDHLLNIKTQREPSETETTNNAFMKYATLILSSLNPRNQIKARGEIMKNLCDLQLEELNELG